MEAQNGKKWYNKTWVVILMSLTLFPISLFVIWRNKGIKAFGKIGLSLISPFSTLATIGIVSYFSILILSKVYTKDNEEVSEQTKRTSSPSAEYLTLADENKYFNSFDLDKTIKLWELARQSTKTATDYLLDYLEKQRGFKMDSRSFTSSGLSFFKKDYKDEESKCQEIINLGYIGSPSVLTYFNCDSSYHSQLKAEIVHHYKLEKDFTVLGGKILDKVESTGVKGLTTYTNIKSKIRFRFFSIMMGNNKLYGISKDGWGSDLTELMAKEKQINK